MRLAALLPSLILLGYAALLTLGASRADPAPPIGSISLEALCRAIQTETPVIFIDVREPAEFAEEHLPRAILLPGREIRAQARGLLSPEAILIPYCLKDFRGFEGAKHLRELGFPDVRLLQGVGLNGWKARGLPTAGPVPAHSDEEAWDALRARCEADS
jgi:phage shock protein E